MNATAITYPYVDRQRADRRGDQGAARRHLRQPLQSRSVLPAGRRHGAGRRHAVQPASRRQPIGQRIGDMTLQRQADRGRQDATRSRAGRRSPKAHRASRCGTSSRRICAIAKSSRPRRSIVRGSSGSSGNPGLADAAPAEAPKTKPLLRGVLNIRMRSRLRRYCGTPPERTCAGSRLRYTPRSLHRPRRSTG